MAADHERGMSELMSTEQLVTCWFYLREPSAEHPGKFRYTHLHYKLPMGMLGPQLAHPPLVGDTIPIQAEEGIRGRFVVVARHWEWTHYGSPNWPHGQDYPTKPRVLMLFVEPAAEAFADEAPSENAETEGTES